MKPQLLIFLVVATLFLSCSSNSKPETTNVTAFVGATLIDGTGNAPVENAVVLVEDGNITLVGELASITIPESATEINLEGKCIMPGIVNAHGHIGGTNGLTSSYSKGNVIRDLKLNASYGVTTVYSLGGDEQASIDVRDEQDSIELNRSRLFVAGEVVTGDTPEQAREVVDKNASMGVDLIKIRVDDNLGTTEKMNPEVYAAVIDQAKKHKLPVVAHIFYLDDAKALLKLGVRFIAHSVRDLEVDEEFINLMKENNAYYCPTLMREVSTYVYESTPSFFEDPFFLAYADTATMRQLKNPERQLKVKENPASARYKDALVMAKKNLKILSDAGVHVAFGTDTGPPARFQGYFEHLELEQMVDAGLSPMQTIVASSRDAVRETQQNKLGTLEPGKKADFIILSANPLDDIKNTRSIESVWIGGNKVR